MESKNKYYQKNREKVIASAILWNKTHKERKKAIDKKFYEKHRRVYIPLSVEERKSRAFARSLFQQCKKVGITVEYYNSLPKVCSNPGCQTTNPGGKNWAKDHNHTTGKFRGLLCHACNTSLGHLNENKNRIAGLILYLEKHSV